MCVCDLSLTLSRQGVYFSTISFNSIYGFSDALGASFYGGGGVYSFSVNDQGTSMNTLTVFQSTFDSNHIVEAIIGPSQLVNAGGAGLYGALALSLSLSLRIFSLSLSLTPYRNSRGYVSGEHCYERPGHSFKLHQ